MLHHIAECQARQLYLPQGYGSIYAYCVGRHKMSDDIACKRIRAARAARRFPFILHALNDGRLHLSGVVMLAPHLTEANAEELLAAAVDKTRAEIELMLARRFPQPDVPTVLAALSPACAAAPSPQPAFGPEGTAELDVRPVELPAPGRVEVPIPVPVQYAKVTPTSPGRYALLTPLRQETHDLLRDVQGLLGHQVAPAEVRRAVWKRDGGRCTFTSDTGHRCKERKDVQFDHIDPYAKGGEASISGIRPLCRAHLRRRVHATQAGGGPEPRIGGTSAKGELELIGEAGPLAAGAGRAPPALPRRTLP